MSVLAKLIGGPAEGKLITVPGDEPIVISRQRLCPHTNGQILVDHGRYVMRQESPLQAAFVAESSGVARVFDWDGWQPA